jgi:PIN domain nuclease of toxin-antitoxin system
VILDTVAFVRLLRGELSSQVLAELESAPVLILSAASIFEINQKVRIGRLDMAPMGTAEIERIETSGIAIAPVTPAVMARAASLSWSVGGRDHRDPFDRMIAAAALEGGVPAATSDRAFRDLPDLTVVPI